MLQSMQEAARLKDDAEPEPLNFPPFLYGTAPSTSTLPSYFDS